MKYDEGAMEPTTPQDAKSAGGAPGFAGRQASMAQRSGSFYFYDLETSGVRPRSSRIMQFGGQRTDLDLKLLGQPDNIIVKLTPDVLPDPDAVLVHGITPQKTLSDGIGEAEFLKYLTDRVFKPNTIFVGFNNIRFDDEFMRFTLWRNFYDAYEWQWKNGSSRWDLLDAARMTRALRPEGIKWPFASDGKPSNRLELLSNVNNLDHSSSHDALSDVKAAIALAKLLKAKQPKLFDYLLNLRNKNEVAALASKGQPFVYTSGRYPSEFEKTTIAAMVTPQPDRNAALVYDLRVSPEKFVSMSPAELAAAWQSRDKEAAYFPVKTLAYNRAPAIAPLGVLDKTTTSRLQLNLEQIQKNLADLRKAAGFDDRLLVALQIMQPKTQTGIIANQQKVDEQLYDGFIIGPDKISLSAVRAAGEASIAKLKPEFNDQRLKQLFPLYKARNYPKSLSSEELKHWEDFRSKRLLDGGPTSSAASFFKRLAELKDATGSDAEKQYLLEELELYGSSIVPLEADNL
jgi:exodeoxyribonuclease-1